jgi:hypothetical protein
MNDKPSREGRRSRTQPADGGSSEAPPERREDDAPRITFQGRRNPRRFQLGWPLLAAIGAGVGFLTGGWPGLVVGGVLGYVVWRLR